MKGGQGVAQEGDGGHANSRWIRGGRVQRPGEPQGLPTGTEDDVATKPVPTGCFIRRAAGLVEGRRLDERGVAMGPEKSGRLPGWTRQERILHRDGIRRSASSAG